MKEFLCCAHKLKRGRIHLLTLRDECRLRVFEKLVLRRIFGPKREGVKRRLEETA
jgi:hypothetical protein